MPEKNKQLGKLESVHGISPVYLQRALIVIILSFIFFLAMLTAFSLRQQIGYFVLATAFLVIKLLTLFGWMMNRKKTLFLYEKGMTLGKQVFLYEEIKKVQLKQTTGILGKKTEGEIIKSNEEKILISDGIQNLPEVVAEINRKMTFGASA